MNTTRTLTPLTLIAATLAATFLVQGAKAALPVVQLEAVHMTTQRVPASRAAVVQLPRVEVAASRMDARGVQAVQVVQVVQLPAVEVSARRSGATGLLAQQRPVAVTTRKPA
jgi:hypothetical protein